MRRGITAEVDLDAAASNLKAVREAACGLPVIAVVKADAYGHGAVEVSSALEKAGADMLAVAFLSEAVALREGGIRIPIVVLFDRTNPELYFEHCLTPVLHDLKSALMFSREAQRRNAVLDVHVKLDTGMGRMGLEHTSDIPKIAGLPNLRIAGLMSHFAEADLSDRDFTSSQIAEFQGARETLHGLGIRPLCHFANSAASLAFREAHFDAIRPGIILYGCSPFDGSAATIPDTSRFRPVMRAKTSVLALRRIPKGRAISYGRTFIATRDTLAAVLAAGYADGYVRQFSNNASVLIKGRRAQVMGRVCMDLVMVDATEIEGVEEFDDAILLGPGGNDEITARELAANAGTIPYEILLWFGRNAHRTYIGGGMPQ